MIESAVIGLSTGSVLFQNTDLQYKVGVGKAYSFANTDLNRVFNGVVYYSRGTLPPTPAPTVFPSVKPSGEPTSFPSLSPSLYPTVVISTNPTSNSTRKPSVSPSVSIAPSGSYLGFPTTFSGDQSNFGNMFELVSLVDVIIEAFDIHTSAESEKTVEIYHRNAGLGALRSPGAWAKISTDNLVVSGQGKSAHKGFIRNLFEVLADFCVYNQMQ